MKYVLPTIGTLLLMLTGCQNHSGNQTAINSPAASQPVATASPAGTPTGESSVAGKSAGELKATPSGLQYQDLVVGDGPKPLFGQTVSVHYTGRFQNGQQFESSLGGRPISFKLGMDSIIKGWHVGIGGDGGKTIEAMRVGGKRKLILPPELAYGKEGNGKIPPNATLIFEVELVGIKKASAFGM
jgi:peptidylprolyl isomerase